MSKHGHRYLITLQHEQPDATEEEATRALRGALKALLRQWDLRCTAASPLPAEPATQSTSSGRQGS